MEREIIYTGGGTEKSLIAISPKELEKIINLNIVEIRKII